MSPPIRSRRILVALASAVLVFLSLGCDAPLPTTVDDPGLDAPFQAMGRKSKSKPKSGLSCTDCAVEMSVHLGQNGKVNLQGLTRGKRKGGKKAFREGPKLHVTVLGSSLLDFSLVDLSTVRIGDPDLGIETPLMKKRKRKEYRAKLVDVNGDGILDLRLHFSLRELVYNENISEDTHSLCLVGSGGGATVGGCFAVEVRTGRRSDRGDDHGCSGDDPDDDGEDGGSGGDGSSNGGGDGNSTGGGGFTLTDLIPFGNSPDATAANKTAWVADVKYWLTDSEDPVSGYPGWKTVGLPVLASQATPWQAWTEVLTPLGSEGTAPDGWLNANCGLNTSAYYWADSQSILLRQDVSIPSGSQDVILRFLVDDEAQVFFNGTEITSGFQYAQYGTCPAYGTVVSVSIPDSLLSPSGNNQIAVWAKDTAGFVNYFDLSVTANVPN